MVTPDLHLSSLRRTLPDTPIHLSERPQSPQENAKRRPTATSAVTAQNLTDQDLPPGDPSSPPRNAQRSAQVDRTGRHLHPAKLETHHRRSRWRLDRETFLLLTALRDGDPISAAVDGAFEGSHLTREIRIERTREYLALSSEHGWFYLPHPPTAQPANLDAPSPTSP